MVFMFFLSAIDVFTLVQNLKELTGISNFRFQINDSVEQARK